MGFPSDVNMEERSGKTRLKGARKPKDPRIRRRLNFHMDKRRDRSKFGNGRLVEPDDIFPDESSGDIFGTALLAREDSGDGFVVAAPNEDSGDGFSVAAPNETSADEVPEATPLPNDASAEEVVEDEAIEDEASEAEVVEEDLPLPNLDSEDVAVADSPLPNEASEDETAGGSPLPNEESEDETVNGAPLPNEASEDATGEDSSFPNEESEDETGDGSTNPNEDLDDELLQEDDYYSLPNEQSSKSPSGLDGSLTESPTFSPNAPPRPGAPTRAPKKTYPPAYFAPLPTPRPTNARPVAPVRPTRRPTKKMTPGPTLTPTMSPRPTIMPSLKPFTESPTFKPSTEADPLPVPTDPPVPDPTEPPTRSPTAVVPRDCVSDEEGNKGPQIAPNQEIVSYRFQVETYATMTEDELNDEALPEAEREISDVLIPPLFYPGGECDALVAEGRSGGLLSLTLQDRVDQAASDKRAEKPKGSRSDGWETQPGGRRWLLDRHMQEEDGLIGLSSSPPDVVIRGRLQNACPAPVTGTGPNGQPLICWVVEGAVTLFGAGDLSWANAIVQASLGEAMANGEFDDGAVDPRVIYVRHIEPGTTLNVTVDEVKDGDDGGDGGTPVWAWVLIGLGAFGLLLSIIYLAIKRKQQQEEFERQKAETEFLSANADGQGDEGDGDDQDGDAENSGEEKEAERESFHDDDAGGDDADGGIDSSRASQRRTSARQSATSTPPVV